MKDGESRDDETSSGKPGILRHIMLAPEGKILIAGIALACLHMGVVALTGLRSAELCRNLLSMSVTHIFGGRAAGMTLGYAQDLPVWTVILVSMSVEAFMVLLFYPLFVLSYDRLIVIKPLEETMARARRAAAMHQGKIMKFGIPGLLLFVWFPFWMTGPLVGAVIGFLIGLRPRVNLAVVLGGTFVAILCWSLILKRVHELLKPVPYIPLVFVGIILLLAISVHIRYAFSRGGGEPDEDDKSQ